MYRHLNLMLGGGSLRKWFAASLVLNTTYQICFFATMRARGKGFCEMHSRTSSLHGLPSGSVSDACCCALPEEPSGSDPDEDRGGELLRSSPSPSPMSKHSLARSLIARCPGWWCAVMGHGFVAYVTDTRKARKWTLPVSRHKLPHVRFLRADGQLPGRATLV